MRYLLVYEHLDRGGIETLIVRMGNWLVNNNHEVQLYVERNGDMAKLLDPRVKLVIPNNRYNFILRPKKLFSILNENQIDCVYTFGPKSSLVGGIIYSHLKNNDRINFFSGIYHSKEFNTGGKINIKGRLYLDFFKNYLKDGTRVFMSEETIKGIEEIAKIKFKGSNIWPLAINIPEQSFNGKPKKIKIVSIGRYVSFKSYNLYMFEVVKELLQKGLDVVWEVYGHGPLKEKMLGIASQTDFEGRVKILNGIPYEKIPKVLEDTFVFIGMGTALLEAGSYGVPCIPAIAYSNSPNSYGYLYDIPYYTCGDNLGYEPNLSMVSLIEKLSDLDSNAFNRHRLKTKEYVMEYGMDPLMSKFLAFTSIESNGKKVLNYSKIKAYKYILIYQYFKFRHKLAIQKRWQYLKNTFRFTV